jgi:sec-independent protein translocase protein TatA
MSIGVWQIVIIVLLLVLLFGRGKISELMGDVAKGIKSFKKGMSEEEDDDTSDVKAINHQQAETIDAKAETKSKASAKPVKSKG